MELHEAMDWAGNRKNGVLITLRKDGRPQSSDILYGIDPEGRFLISLTDTRAKTRNLRRDPRAVLHVSDPASWSYVSFDGTVELSAVVEDPHDAAADALVAYFETVAGKPHRDWEDYRRSLVEEKRLLATFTPTSAVGIIRPAR